MELDAMEFEVLLPQLGELRREDARRALKDAYETVSSIRVLVLGRPGEMPSVGAVELRWSQSGRGRQRMLICPACGSGRRSLHADGAGGLRCATCLRRRTRHQLEKGRADYWNLGGREEDRLLRLVQTGKDTRRVGHLADQILARDHAQLDALRAKVSAALAIAETKE